VTDLALATSIAELFEALCERHGGRDRLSVVDREVVMGMCRLLSTMRGADADALPKLIDAYAKLEGMLPAPATSKVTTIRDYAAARAGASP